MSKNELGPETDFEDFEKGVRFIKDAVENNAAKFYFEPAKTGIIFKNPPTRSLVNSYELEFENIEKIIDEIIELLTITLSGQTENIISNIEADDEILKTFKERSELIEKELVTWNLLKRYQLQKNYKTSLLDKFDWDIIIKRKEFKGKILTFPTAMLRIRTRKPFSDNPPVIKTETITLETGIEEIENLINELNKAKSALSDEEES